MKDVKNEKQNRHMFIQIMVLALFIAFMFPFFIILINSAKTASEVSFFPMALPTKWGNIFTNIRTIWTSDNISYPSSLLSSALITSVSLILLNFLAAQAAWALVRTKSKTSSTIFFIFIAAMVIPFQVVMFPLLSWFRSITVFTGIKLLRSYSGMILAYIGFGISLSIFMFHGFIKSIPLELEEAATIDGCHRMQLFYQIVFPLLTPIQATVAVLNGIWIWNDYNLPLLVLGKGNAVQTIPLAVSNFAGSFVKQWDLIMTAILLAMIPIVICFFIAQKYIVKGMLAGSIK